MVFSKDYVGYLARELTKKLIAGNFIETAQVPIVTERVHAALLEEMSLEDRINDEVRVILEAYSEEMRKTGANYQEMFKKIKNELVRKYKLGPSSFAIEVASNDGYLLRNFVDRGIDCLGIDPADGPVAQANAIGVPTIHDFFGSRRAKELANEGKLADVVIGNNVVAHVDDINDFVAGIARLLKPTGVAVFEFAYALDMIQHCEFDTILHEHVFYHTLHGLTPLFQRHGLYLNDVERLPVHGGSLRLTVSRSPARSAELDALFAHEAALGVDKESFYKDFAARVRALRDSLASLLVSERAHHTPGSARMLISSNTSIVLALTFFPI